jgi:hypothetical protein
MRENQQIIRPPGVIATLTKGLDLTAKHLWLGLVPVALDVFFWLGPRLSFRQLIEQLVVFWQQEAIVTGLNEEVLLELAPHTNLLTSLSVPLIGVPTYVVGPVPERTPIATRVFELENVWIWAALFILLSLIGLFLTSVYMGLVSEVVRKQQPDGEIVVLAHGRWKRFFLAWLQLLATVIVLLIVAVILYIPLLLISSLLFLFNGQLATLVLFTGPIFGVWLLFYLVFVPHGLILTGRPIWRAVVESFKLVQLNLLPVLGLLISVVVINQGLDWLLLTADDGSWFSLISIVGHAYVNTALVVATFVFYRHRYAILVGEN